MSFYLTEPEGIGKHAIRTKETYPSFSCNCFTCQYRAQVVITVIQLFIQFPNDAFKEICESHIHIQLLHFLTLLYGIVKQSNTPYKWSVNAIVCV